jgi:hypothetical protein
MPAVPPSVSEIETIAGLAEPIFRNLSITGAYAQLSRAFADWCPGGANWCTFATWASQQAGRTIRKEDLAWAVGRRLQERLAQRPILREVERALGMSGERLVSVAGGLSQGLPGIDRASDAVARGNRKVFEEIGREFAAFLATVAIGDAAIRAFVDGLRRGPSPGGQDLLRRSFTNYLAARNTPDAGDRAQLILLANVQIGLHEQTRLQPEIREAMDAALLDVADTRRRIVDRLDRIFAAGPLRRVHTGVGRRLLNRVADEMAEELRVAARLVTTERLMTIGLPRGRTLRLGSDVRGSFPAGLRTLTNPEIVALLADYDATPDSTLGSGARDWSVLAQRLHFIADFFRAYQEDPMLFDAPFEPAPALTRAATGLAGIAHDGTAPARSRYAGQVFDPGDPVEFREGQNDQRRPDDGG